MEEHTNEVVTGDVKAAKKRRFKKPSNKTLFITVLAIVAVGLAIWLGVRYQNAQDEIKRLSNPTEAAKLESEILVERVSKLVELPSGETPTVATVSDVSKLKEQKFFEHAENGDKVLIYTKAKKAILYRPSTNKVIQIAPVNIGKNQQQTQGTTHNQ